MDIVTVGLGIAALVYGLYTLYARRFNPKGFGKLDAMKKAWGPRAGFAVHFFAYTIMPIVIGVALIYSGIRGVSILGM